MKRKRWSELIHETFVKEKIVVNGVQRNLTLPEGVVGKAGMVIKEPEDGIFLYNGNFDMVFQKRTSNEDSLGVKHQRAVKDSLSESLSEHLRRIQVKDIVKEVKDYLKTYSSARMDINCKQNLASLNGV
nr:hypothetical protein [Tanacetum cinerariifolium]